MATILDEERKKTQVQPPAFPQNQPPSGSIYAGARRPGQAIREAMPATAQAVDDARERATSAFQRGNNAAGVGQIARGAVVAPLVAATEVGANLLGAAGDIAGSVGKPVAQAAYSAFTGSNDQLFAGGARATPQAAESPASQRAALPSPTPGTGSVGAGSRAAVSVDNLQSRAGAGQSISSQASAPVAESEFQPTRVGGVYRRGNTFTDEAGTRDTAFLNRGPVSAQNMQAADQLATKYAAVQRPAVQRMTGGDVPQGRGFQPQQARQFDRAASIRALTDITSPEYRLLRQLQMEARNEAEANAKIGRAARGNNGAAQAYAALISELTGGTRQGQTAEMQDAGATTRAGMQEAGATERAAMSESGQMSRAGMNNEVQRGELAVKRGEFGMRARSDQRLTLAQDELIAADTPEKQAAAQRKIQALTGRGGEKFTVVRGGQQYDPEAGAMRNLPDMVIDSQGRPIAMGGMGATAGRVAPTVGTVQDGYRFKGGNPADQANWEKAR